MHTAQIFRHGNSQAVRIPRAFAFRSSLVYIERCGDEIVLREGPVKLGELIRNLPHLPPDFPDAIEELDLEQREVNPEHAKWGEVIRAANIKVE